MLTDDQWNWLKVLTLVANKLAVKCILLLLVGPPGLPRQPQWLPVFQADMQAKMGLGAVWNM